MENYKNPITFVVMAKRHGTRKLYWWGWIFRLRKSGGNDWPHCVPLKLFIVQPQSLWEVKGSCKKGPSAETQGSESGQEKLEARPKFSSTGGRAPGYRLSQDHFQTVKRILASDWAQKMLCIIVPNRRTASPEFFLWVRTWRLLTRSLDCLAHGPKKYTQSVNFQFDINFPFQNTVYSKTKDAFPKIQAWAFNRYSRLHRSSLHKY